ALVHAMNAGDALLQMRELVPAGKWEAHVRSLELNERSARVYQQVAKARAKLERQSSAGPLSIAAALEYLKDKKSGKNSAAKTKTKKGATSCDVLGWWVGATIEARRQFLDDVGLQPILAALPSTWRAELMRRARAVASPATRSSTRSYQVTAVRCC